MVSTATLRHRGLFSGSILLVRVSLHALDTRAEAINSHFKVIKFSNKSFKQCVDWFEGTLKLVANPDQFMPYTAFVKELMNDPTFETIPFEAIWSLIEVKDTEMPTYYRCFLKL